MLSDWKVCSMGPMGTFLRTRLLNDGLTCRGLQNFMDDIGEIQVKCNNHHLIQQEAHIILNMVSILHKKKKTTANLTLYPEVRLGVEEIVNHNNNYICYFILRLFLKELNKANNTLTCVFISFPLCLLTKFYSKKMLYSYIN